MEHCDFAQHFATMSSFEEEMQALCTKYKKDPAHVLKQEGDVIEIPESVKKVVVEHLIQDKSSVHRRKLRLFSGSQPTPNGEINFVTWRISAKQILDDASITENEKRRCIMESLLIPALNIVKHVPPQKTSKDIFDILAKVYGAAKSAKEMLHDFYAICQRPNQTASEYLQQLYTELLEIVDESPDAVNMENMDDELLQQFVRGCFDDDVLNKLHLEEKDTAPRFEVLFENVRKEEMKRDQKKKRMEVAFKGKKPQQHNVTTSLKQAEGTVTEMQQLDRKCEDFNQRLSALESGQKALFEQLNSISEQLKTAFSSSQPSHDSPAPHQPSSNRPANSPSVGATASKNYNSTSQQQATSRPTRFCYNCGIDNHHMQRCRNPANPELVQEKLKKRFAARSATNRSENVDFQDQSNC